jgi:adenine-specific DNA methylase
MNMHSQTADRFRPIQYLGNKSRLLEEIATAVASVVAPTRPVADLFSGTAVVGRRLARRNAVIAVDVQAYAEILGRAMLLGRPGDFDDFDMARFLARAEDAAHVLDRLFAPLIAREDTALAALRAGDPGPISAVIEGGSPVSMAQGAKGDLPRGIVALLAEHKAHAIDATATLAFGGVYFSYAQAIRLDALHHAASLEAEPRRPLLIAAMLGVASDVVNTVGKQFAQPIRLFDKLGRAKPLLIQRTLRDRSLLVLDMFVEVLARWRAALLADGAGHRVLRSDVDAFIASDAEWDAAYADPPYTIDHYSRFYHVLETLARRDRPTLSRMRKGGIPTIMRGLYRDDRFQSDFCVPSKAPDAFYRLFAGVAKRGVPLVLSYSGHEGDGQRSRTLAVDDLVALARRSFRRVEITEPRFEGHRKLNAAHRNAATERGSERLIICRS